MRDLLGEGQLIVPGLDELVVEEVSAGLRPATPDNAPLIGEAGNGAIWATGHHRNGILLAPLTADAIAAMLCDEPPPPEIEPFTPERLAVEVHR
jgi:glycine oxidase